MKTKEIYMKPEMEVVELEANVVIAGSLGTEETDDSHPGRVRRRNFWTDEESL